jgi:hypothetical protein
MEREGAADHKICFFLTLLRVQAADCLVPWASEKCPTLRGGRRREGKDKRHALRLSA